MRATRGFTLLELMTVVAVMGILAALAAFAGKSLVHNQKVRGAVGQIYVMARQARTSAAATNQPVRFRYTARSGSTPASLVWERLPCSDSWGTACPLAGCSGSACGSGGCVQGDGGCPEISDTLTLPDELDASALNNVCFIAGTAQPSTDCQTPVSGATLDLSLAVANAKPQILRIEKITGISMVIDCENPQVAGVCP